MSLAALLFATFVGRNDIYAVAQGDGFRPSARALTVEDVKLHTDGKQCFGFYVMQPGDVVTTTAIDFDGKHESDWKERATSIADWLRGAGFETLTEVSQSGTGAHVWMFFSEPVDAWLVRAFWRWSLRRASVECREIFPKQDRVAGKGLGNLIRYPLWRESHFVDSDWERLDPDVALEGLERYTAENLQDVATRGGAVLTPDPSVSPPPDGPTLPPRVMRAIAGGVCRDRWNGVATGLRDPSKSGISMSFACCLIKSYVPTAEIEIALREWCERHGAEEKGRREDWIRRTVANAYDFVIEKTSRVSENAATAMDALRAYLDSCEIVADRYAKTGIRELDDSIDGVAFGEVCIAAARPSHGKSAFGIHWADAQSNAGRPVLIISEEMSLIALGGRWAARVLGFDESKYVAAEMRDDYLERASQYFGGGSPIYIRQSCRSVERAVEVIEQHVATDGVRCVVIDYTQLLKGHSESKREDVGEVSEELRRLTTRTGIALLSLCQLNRKIEDRDNLDAKMSDLGDSGQLERDADIILALRWPFKDGPQYDKRTKTTTTYPEKEYRIQVIKRRNGPIRAANITTTFDAKTQTIGGYFVAPPGASS